VRKPADEFSFHLNGRRFREAQGEKKQNEQRDGRLSSSFGKSEGRERKKRKKRVTKG